MRGLAAIAIAGLSLLCAAGLAGAGVGKWGPPHGLYGGQITSLAIDPRNPSILYAATPYAGVFKSTNGARSWRPAKNGLERVGFGSTLAVDPHSSGTVYLGGARLSNDTTGGVFKTTDGGRSWRRTGLGVARAVFVIAVDPHTPGTVYAGTGAYERPSGIFKSTNGGRSWMLMTDDLGSEELKAQSVNALVVDPHAPATIYAATWPGGVFKSTDGGRTWRAVNTGLEKVKIVESVVVDPVTPNTLYAGAIGFFRGEHRGVFKSTDGGVSWTRASVGLRDESVIALAIDPRNTATLYADTQNGIFKTVDGGGTWTAITSDPTGASQIVVDPRNPNSVYVGTRWGETRVGHGIFKSVDGGRAWRAANAGLASVAFGVLAAHPRRDGVVYAGTFDNGAFRSSDGGRSWRAFDVGDDWVRALEISQGRPSTLYLARGYDGVSRSTDAGRTWRRADAGLQAFLGRGVVNAFAIHPRDAATVYAATPYGVFKTTNGGRGWRDLGTELTYVGALSIDPRTPTTVYAATRSIGILKSTNAGSTWGRVNTGLPVPGASVAAVATDPRRPGTLYAALTPRFRTSRTPAGIFKSTDNGRSWRAANGGLPKGRKAAGALAIDPRAPANVYAVVNGDVFRSTNAGRTWHRFENGLGPREVTQLEISASGRVLYAGAANGEIVDYRVRS